MEGCRQRGSAPPRRLPTRSTRDPSQPSPETIDALAGSWGQCGDQIAIDLDRGERRHRGASRTVRMPGPGPISRQTSLAAGVMASITCRPRRVRESAGEAFACAHARVEGQGGYKGGQQGEVNCESPGPALTLYPLPLPLPLSSRLPVIIALLRRRRRRGLGLQIAPAVQDQRIRQRTQSWGGSPRAS
jgi:hypothetical protein